MIKESALRATVLNSLNRIETTDLLHLNSIVNDVYGGLLKLPLSLEMIQRTSLDAVRSNRWIGNTDTFIEQSIKNRVGVGYYNSEATYFSHLFHELGHNLVGQMGRPRKYYDNYPPMADEEEKMCWRFAIAACEITSLPFDIRVMDISTSYWRLVQDLSSNCGSEDNENTTGDMFAELGKLEKLYFGYSMCLGDEFYWDNEVPVIKKNIYLA